MPVPDYGLADVLGDLVACVLLGRRQVAEAGRDIAGHDVHGKPEGRPLEALNVPCELGITGDMNEQTLVLVDSTWRVARAERGIAALHAVGVAVVL